MRRLLFLLVLIPVLCFSQGKLMKFDDATVSIIAGDTTISVIGTKGYIGADVSPAITPFAETFWLGVLSRYLGKKYQIRVIDGVGNLILEGYGRPTMTNRDHPRYVIDILKMDIYSRVQVSTDGGETWEYLYYMGGNKGDQPWATIPMSN